MLEKHNLSHILGQKAAPHRLKRRFQFKFTGWQEIFQSLKLEKKLIQQKLTLCAAAESLRFYLCSCLEVLKVQPL